MSGEPRSGLRDEHDVRLEPLKLGAHELTLLVVVAEAERRARMLRPRLLEDGDTGDRSGQPGGDEDAGRGAADHLLADTAWERNDDPSLELDEWRPAKQLGQRGGLGGNLTAA